MSNIIDYLNWRGDLSFKTCKLNEVDKLIFMRISYLPFIELDMNKDDIISIEELMIKLENVPEEKYIWPEDKRLLNILGTKERFKNIKVSDYVEILDKSLEKQFSAIVINFSEDEKIVVYRGTDMSLVGWKEDFNMSFEYNVPSQIEGVNYLNYIGNKYTDSYLYLLGHSKGGNIAMYSGIFCLDLIKLRIKEIVTADSPGLTQEIIKDIRYLDVKNKIISFIPQTSIVGRMLEMNNNYRVVKSIGNMFMQHDLYTWDVGPTFLIQIKDATRESDFAYNVMKEYLLKTTTEERKRVINIIYEVLESLDVENVVDIPKILIKNTKKVLKKYKNISEDDKKQLEDMMKQIKNIVLENIKLELVSQNIIKDNKVKKIDKKTDKNKHKFKRKLNVKNKQKTLNKSENNK